NRLLPALLLLISQPILSTQREAQANQSDRDDGGFGVVVHRRCRCGDSQADAQGVAVADRAAWRAFDSSMLTWIKLRDGLVGDVGSCSLGSGSRWRSWRWMSGSWSSSTRVRASTASRTMGSFGSRTSLCHSPVR